MINLASFKKDNMGDSLFCYIVKAIVESEEHYRNYEKCRRLASLIPQKRIQKIYRRNSIVHKALALIVYDRAMAIRSTEIAKSVDKS